MAAWLTELVCASQTFTLSFGGTVADNNTDCKKEKGRRHDEFGKNGL